VVKKKVDKKEDLVQDVKNFKNETAACQKLKRKDRIILVPAWTK
jgi:hypothetical protein